MSNFEGLRDKATKLLAKIEADLHEADRCDDDLGKHGRAAADATTAELAKLAKGLGPAGNDPDKEAEYLWLLGQRRRAETVAAMAEKARVRR